MAPATGFRAGNEKRVDADGGNFGRGIIRGFATCSVGPALGHDLWCDETMIEQISTALEAAGSNGVKVRYTHGNMSGDGIEDQLGRATFAESETDQKSRADLHIVTMAQEEKRRQVLTGAEETPEDFGASILFYRDFEAEREFMLANGAEEKEEDNGRRYIDYSGYQSPDERNTENFPHSRLGELVRVDIVGDPAANADGMFGQFDDTFAAAQALLEFAIGIRNDAPESHPFGELPPDRIKSFVQKAIATHWSHLVELRESQKPPTEKPAEQSSGPSDAEVAAITSAATDILMSE